MHMTIRHLSQWLLKLSAEQQPLKNKQEKETWPKELTNQATESRSPEDAWSTKIFTEGTLGWAPREREHPPSM